MLVLFQLWNIAFRGPPQVLQFGPSCAKAGTVISTLNDVLMNHRPYATPKRL